MTTRSILDDLETAGAVMHGKHFVYTSGNHGPAYINMRVMAHRADWLEMVGIELARRLQEYEPDIIVGPETLGRNLAQFAGAYSASGEGIWCDIVDVGPQKVARFSPKLNFEEKVNGRRVAIVDDLLTTGSSIALTAELILRSGGLPVAAGAVVRRTPDVNHAKCGVPELEVLVDVPGFAVLTPEVCASHGPCSKQTPVVLRPGHGHEWIREHPDYPVADAVLV